MSGSLLSEYTKDLSFSDMSDNRFQYTSDDLHVDDSEEEIDASNDNDCLIFDEPMEMKDKMYQSKLTNLKKQIQQLKDYVYPDYVKRIKELERIYRDKLRINALKRDLLLQSAEQDFINDKKTAHREFEDKKVDLKDTLLNDLEERRRLVEIEKNTLDLSSELTEAKTAMSRKLRRRANDPMPLPDKRRKMQATNIIALLDEKDIESDLKALQAKPTFLRKTQPEISPVVMTQCATLDCPILDVRTEDGKLLYEKRWYHRGQPVFVEGRDIGKCPANIIQINTEAILVKKIDGNKLRILISQLKYGLITLKRRVP